ncbi:hypothetical protein DSO57_1005806 [Entomophthora muscae]|uniref:Uncharacterized protein n=1 Tax=Entomophthora muscae TaxID=34485 RepID=A0ACC2TIM3_9FUNG|nr:hypothetical protein DSO57_1005806 [Entomophthora muscae]
MPSDARAQGIYLTFVAGYPAINIPIGYKQDGSSLGMLLYAKQNTDEQILHLAQALQRSGLFRRRRPRFLGFEQ